MLAIQFHENFLKLAMYGLGKEAVLWFKSYLTDRLQCVQVNNVVSSSLMTKCGVPQGSILGSLLFILYMNDLPTYVQNVSFSLYADDTVLYTSSKSY